MTNYSITRGRVPLKRLDNYHIYLTLTCILPFVNISWQRAFWLKRDTAGHREVTINNATTVAIISKIGFFSSA